MLEDTISTFKLVAKDKGITLTAHIADDLPLILVDVERINQVVFNLLTNAPRHTPPEGIIEIKAYSDDTELRIVVQDTGEGIAPEDPPHVFKRFYRVDRSRQRASGGTGLGLAIARSIVKAHEDTLTVQSEGIPGRGTFLMFGYLGQHSWTISPCSPMNFDHHQEGHRLIPW